MDATPTGNCAQSSGKKMVHFFYFFFTFSKSVLQPLRSHPNAPRCHQGHQESQGTTQVKWGIPTLLVYCPLLLPPPMKNGCISPQTPSLAKRTTVRLCVGCIETTPASDSPPIQKKNLVCFFFFIFFHFFRTSSPAPLRLPEYIARTLGTPRSTGKLPQAKDDSISPVSPPPPPPPHRSFPSSPTTPQTIPKQFQGTPNVSPSNILHWLELIRTPPGSIRNYRVN
jgi:hypothetical protein